MSKRIPIQKTLHAIAATLDRPARAYDAARAQHRELAPYASPRDVLRALRPGSSLSDFERDALLVAVLGDHQRAPEPVWQSILLVAFEPMLVRLRKRIHGKRDAEDRDQDVLLGFLEAIRAVRVGPFVVHGIRWATQAHVFGAVRRDRLERGHAPFDDDRTRVGPPGLPTFEKVAAAEMMELFEAEGGKELLEAVVVTEASDEPLSEYVERVYAERSPRERASLYDRLWRARKKVLAEIGRRVGVPAQRAEEKITTAA
jgi:hypothetical protein